MASFPLVISFVVTAMILPAFKPESVSSQFNFSKLSVFGDLFFKAPFAMAVIVFLFAFVGFGLINCIAYIFADLVNNRFMVALTPFMIYFFLLYCLFIYWKRWPYGISDSIQTALF